MMAFLTSRLGLGLVGSLLLAFGVWAALAWHSGKVDARIEREVKASITARDAQWQGAFDRMKAAADQWQQNYERERDARASARRQAHETEIGRIGAAADALRLRGPGAAAADRYCRSIADPRASAAAGGREPAAAGPAAPADRVPDPDWPTDGIVVSLGWLTQRGREFDELLDESRAWRLHDAEQRDLIHDAREDLRRRLEAAQPRFGREVVP